MNILDGRIAPTSTNVALVSSTTISCEPNTILSLTISPTIGTGSSVAAVVYTIGNKVVTINRAPSRNPLTYPAVFNMDTIPAGGDTVSGTAVVYDAAWSQTSAFNINCVFTTLTAIPEFDILETASNDAYNTVLVVGETSSSINTIHLWTSAVTSVTAATTTPTISSLSFTTTSTEVTAQGTALADSGSVVFVSNMGRTAYAQYTSVATSVTATQADNLVLVGGYNYIGNEASVSTALGGYTAYTSTSAAWPVIGRTELTYSTITNGSPTILLPYGSDWAFTTDIDSVTGTWVNVTSATSTWEVSAASIGYSQTNPTEFTSNIASAFGDCSNAPVTALYAQTTFNYVSSASNAIRFQVDNNDATVMYLNGVRIGTNNTVTNIPYVVCDTSGATTTDHYFPISALNVGTNVLSIELYRSEASTMMSFDIQVSSGTIPTYLPAYYGSPSQTHAIFNYVPEPKHYYSKVLDGGVEVFVLDVSRKTYASNCLAHNQQFGVTVGSEQYEWFANAVSNSTARWKIVSLYDPWENSVADRSTLPTMVDWAFKSHGIDLIIAGSPNGINEHMIINGLHVVNLGVDTLTPTNVNDVVTSPYKVWQDVTSLVSGIGAPAFALVEATPTLLTVTIKRADATSRNLRQFVIT